MSTNPEAFIDYGRRITYSDGRVEDYRIGLDEDEARALVGDDRDRMASHALDRSAVHPVGAELVVRTMSAWQVTE